MGGKPASKAPRPKKLRRALARANPLTRQQSAASNASSSAASTASAMPHAPPPPARVERSAPPPRGGMLFDLPSDRALAERQRASIRFIAARLGGQLLSGSISLRSTAMPVHLNEPRSFLQRLTDDLPYATLLLGQAAGALASPAGTGPGDHPPVDQESAASPHFSRLSAITTAPIPSPVFPISPTPPPAGPPTAATAGVAGAAHRLGLVAAFLVSGIHNSATLAKAFNPHIGETYSATFGPPDAPVRVYLEQTRHHPPVSHFVASTTGAGPTAPSAAWSLSGYTSFDSNFRIQESALFTRRTGIVAVDFGGDQHDRIVYSLPVMAMRGVLGGERRVDVQGPCSLYYQRYGLVIDLLFDPMHASSGGGGGGPGAVVSAAASLIPTFGFFGAADQPSKSASEVEADTRDSIADAVRGVLYQVEPDSETAFTSAYSAGDGSSSSTFFGNPDLVAEALAASSTNGSAERLSSTTEPCAPSDAIELRSDKDVSESVTLAWAAGLDEEDVEPSHGDEASPAKLSRRILALASGSWLSHFDIAGERLWDISLPRHDPVPVPLDQSLPSDSRFRTDIAALEEALSLEQAEVGGDMRERESRLDAAQHRKEELEDEMRGENRLRPVKESVTDSFFPKVHLGVNPK